MRSWPDRPPSSKSAASTLTSAHMIPLHLPWLDSEEETAVLRVLRSGRLAGNGAECAALERELQDRLGGGVVLALSSATHALELMMLLLNLEGGEVIVPSFTFPSVGCAIVRARWRHSILRGSRTRSERRSRSRAQPRWPHDASAGRDALRRPSAGFQEFPGAGRRGRGACARQPDRRTLMRNARRIRLPQLSRDQERRGRRRRRADRPGSKRRRDRRGSSGRREPTAKTLPQAGSITMRGSDRGARSSCPSCRRPSLASSWERWIAFWKSDAVSLACTTASCPSSSVRAGSPSCGPRRTCCPATISTRSWSIRRCGMTSSHGWRPAACRLRRTSCRCTASPFGRSLTGGLSLPRTERVAASIIRLPIYPGLADEDVRHVVDLPARSAGRMMRISVVLPIYLNRPHLPELYRRLTSTLSTSADRYEIIFVDDKGPDDSLEWLTEVPRSATIA